MRTQHTPGPWKMGFNSSGEQAIIGKDGAVVADASWAGGSRCELSIDNPADEKLIAAAPDLLDALKDAYALAIGHATTYQFQHELCELHPTHQEILDKARAVIAKATGAA